MILLFLISQLLACEFQFIYNQEMQELSYDIPQADFTAFGIWTRYYAFYLDVSIRKEKYQYFGRQFDAYQIMSGSYDDGTPLNYFLIMQNGYLNHLLILNSEEDEYYQRILLFKGDSYEGVWMFTYIGLDNNYEEIMLFLVNTKTALFQQQNYERQDKFINSIQLFGEGSNKYQFSGQISFTQSQSLLVKFYSGDELVNYLQSCDTQNSCTLNQITKIISGIMDTQFNTNLYQIIQDNYWMDGWFIFTPSIQVQKYNNLIMQLVHNGRELYNNNDIIPFKISLNFDQNNLGKNGVTLEIASYTRAIHNDSDSDSIQVQFFNQAYQKLLQNWVYFRFLQYDHIDHNVEFYLSFSDSNYVDQNIGQLNLFKYGNLYIYLGQSQIYSEKFQGQLANINIQSCLQSYPQAKRACHFTCLTCFGPMDYNCLSCVDQIQSKRVLNPMTNTCNCEAGLITVEGYVQCMNIENLIQSAKYSSIKKENISCKNGQFQYENSSIKCLDCPQQSTLGLQCANCLENPLSWQEKMICSYDYYQQDHNENNTFVKYNRPYDKIDYYYIQDDELLICIGCNLNEGHYEIVKDKSILYGSCQKTYYYNDLSCYPCQQNCKECEDYTGRCSKCETGYVLYNQICQICPDNCLTCQYTYSIICTQCLEGFTSGKGICQQCDTNCLICDFDPQLNRPKCRVCKYKGYFLPFDGIDCIQNTIQNCLIQYQQQIEYLGELDENQSTNSNQNGVDLTIRYNIKTTLGFQKTQPLFRPIIRQIITNNCALCAPKFMNGDTYCSFNDTLLPNEQVLIRNNYGQCCLNQNIQDDTLNQNVDVCKDVYFEQDGIECKREILSTNLIYLISSQSSNQEVYLYCDIDQCNMCLNVENQFRCIQCSQGFYPEILSGLCFSCPEFLSCNTCQQQNFNYQDGWKWSIRAYSYYQFKSDLTLSIKKEDYEVICITCPESYMLFNNRCILKCPINCKKCIIINDLNVCSSCEFNDKDKRLTILNNQCSNCPQNCEFCQPRQPNDVKYINYFYDPDDSSYTYYSYICLKSGIDQGIFYNQFFQQYFKCQDEDYCLGQLKIKLNAYCDQESYEKEKSKHLNQQDFNYQNINIFNNSQLFINIETPQLIRYLNGIQIEQLIYELILISSSDYCSLNTNLISTNLPKNVFTLVFSKLIINANNLTLNSQNAEIQNFSEVQFQQCHFDPHFLLQIKHPKQLVVRFKDVYYVSDEQNMMQILIENPSKIEVDNFHIQMNQMNLDQDELEQTQIISWFYSNSSTITYLDIQIEKLNIAQSQFQYDFLFLPRLFYINLNISNSKIESTFYKSAFIKNQLLSHYGQIKLNNVSFIIKAFNAATIQFQGYFDVYCLGKLTGIFENSYFIRTTSSFNIEFRDLQCNFKILIFILKQYTCRVQLPKSASNRQYDIQQYII